MKKKILLVEGDVFYSKIFQEGLEKEGFDIKTAMDGEEALRALKKDTPDLILLDLIMPVKNGFEFLEEMKAEDKFKAVPVIILTVLGQDADKEKGMELGAVDYLVKTEQTMDTVVEKVKKYI